MRKPLRSAPGIDYTGFVYVQTTTHSTLLARLADSEDPAAWNEFQDRYGELIRGFARRRNLQPVDCDDVLQHVLLSLSRAMPGFRYDPSRGMFRSYLKTVALRAVFKKKRQKRNEPDLGDIEEAVQTAQADSAIEDGWETEWRRYHMRQAMRVIEAQISSADCQAFQRYALEGQDARATAAALGLSVDQVYQAKSRITKRLAEQVALQVQEEG